MRHALAGIGIALLVVAVTAPPDRTPPPSMTDPAMSVDSLDSTAVARGIAPDSTPLTKLQIVSIAMFEVAPALAIHSAVDQIMAFRDAHQVRRIPVAVVGVCYPERVDGRNRDHRRSHRTCAPTSYAYQWASPNHRPPSTS